MNSPSSIPGTRRQRWLRRTLKWMGRLTLVLGVLGGIVLLSAVLSPWVQWPSAVEQPAPPSRARILTEEAAHALLVGNLSEARQRLEGALIHDPRDVAALLMQACLALEAADAKTAAAALARLRELVPGRVEPQFLQRLLEHRTQLPGTGWRHAFLRAWTELGHPGFVDSPLLPEFDLATQGFAPPDGWKHSSSDTVRLALVLASSALSEESARWLMTQVPVLEDAAFVQAAAAALLSAELPSTLRGEARAVVHQRLTQLVNASPQEMQPRLVLLWAEAPEESAFTLRELEQLDAIAALPHWKAASFWQTFLKAHGRLRDSGLPYPRMGAYHVASWSNTHGATYVLAKRAEVTRKQLLPGARQRQGHILWKIGSRLSEQSTVMERLVGLQLMEQGAADLGDEAEHERIASLQEAAKALRNAMDMAAIERWPLPSLWEEVAEARARDEWALQREFATPLAGMEEPPQPP